MTMLSMPRPTLADLSIEPGLPTVVSPRAGVEISLDEAAPRLRAIVDDTLERAGGVLFTGFRVGSIDAFQVFAASFGYPLIGYEFASTPRSQVEGAVYTSTSTEYPPHRSIPLHNEQSYTREWPLRISFHCALAARSGGATPIADSRAIYRALDPMLVARFARRELLYVPRNVYYGDGAPLEADALAQIRGVLDQERVVFPWLSGDVLRLDNMLTAHARDPFEGPRKVVVAMAQSYREGDDV